MAYCRDCGTKIYGSGLYCQSCANEIIEESRDRIRDADASEQQRMRNDRDYAHSWLQDLIGWITGLMSLMSTIVGGCFITSAAVRHCGLGDDCQEMAMLRSLRDEFMIDSGSPTRLRDLEEYQIVGGALARWVDSRYDSSQIWDYVSGYVFETVDHIKAGRFGQAYDVFKSRTLRLRKDVLLGAHR